MDSFRPLQGLPIINKLFQFVQWSDKGFRPLQGLPIINVNLSIYDEGKQLLKSFRPLQGLPIINTT